ncbi:MAG: histidine phosphatase family protein [Halioglobus sp.]
MLITIWRHGEAGLAVTDQQRELTIDGRADLARGSQAFLQLCKQRQLPAPDCIFQSPYTRTKQTAEILATALTRAEIISQPALEPGSQVSRVDSLLEQVLGEANAPEHLVLVSHQPLVTYLLDHWLGERGQVASLAPGACACLRLEYPAFDGARLQFAAFPPNYEAVL